MNDIEKQLFEKLMNDRKESAANLEKPSMRGLKTSVVEKYSDQAHFIYELIQNADDVGATEARFELLKDRLVFVHNGTRHFNVSDLEKEEEDTATGNLGDLNAITSIANSNKTSASIGKFGVGFKAVFQYTTTPYIYDPEISFKIERFIVPVIIEDTCDYKTKDETAFVFPFNHPDRHAEEAYEDIFHKLQNLLFPTLFLNNLRKISYVCGKKHGYYEKKVKETRIMENTVAERLEFINGQIDNPDKMWLFSRKTEENYKYSVGFIFDTEGKLKQTDYYAFCFFPTKKTTNLNFIINAPFLLTDSREGIKANDKHNVRMIELLAKLASDSFVYLRDIGLELGKMYIDDDILDYLPINEELYTPKNERDDISLRPFFEEIKKTFSTEKILPSFDEYIDASNAYAPFWAVISELFSNNQLAELMNNDDAKWVLPSKGYETYYRARDGKADYLRSVLGRTTNYYIEDLKIIELLTPSFIENQSEKWILKLYDFILETDRRVTSSDIPNSVAVDVGTIHGFQGDECDIVIALFNPPPSISTSKDMFLNRQNIVNVAISRAKDYLFVLLPDDETENVQNLFLINKLRRIIEKDFYVEKSTKELEELLFDDDSYLEKNAFSTGHQLVNVYGLPEKKYEIRSEENAVDVQVHGEVYYAPFAKADEEDRPMTIEELVNAVLEETVTHGKYGDGSVINCDGKYIEVEFESGVHTFSFPFCFDGHLTLNSNIELQEKILRVVRE